MSARQGLLAAVAVVLLAVAFAGAALAQTEDPLAAEALAIAEDLQCPICGGQSVADSQSQLAQQMRAIIRKRLSEGETRESIIRYLVDRYGEAILREPVKGGFNDVLWWLPAAGLFAGAGLLTLYVHRRLHSRRSDGTDAPPDLAAYERQFEAEIRGEGW